MADYSITDYKVGKSQLKRCSEIIVYLIFVAGANVFKETKKTLTTKGL